MSTKARAIAAALIMLFAFLLAQGVSAQGPEGSIPSFDVWLAALSGPLVGAAVALLLSIAVEYVPVYKGLAPRWKRVVFFGLCMIVPIGAASLRAGLGYVAWSFDPLIWHAMWNGAAAAGVGTLAHTRKLPN